MSLPVRHEAPPRRAIDDAIRAIPLEWFKASPAIYWADLLSSAAIGWSALTLGVLGRGWPRAAALAVAVFALYHAVLFIHEITHRARRDVPGFTFAWNALVGVPLLLPSFVYENVHTDHHRQRTYGTPEDPEYVPFGRRSPVVLAAYVVASFFAPVILAVRFAILAPLGWLVPRFGRVVSERCSALVINHEYVRHAPIDAAARAEEAAAFAVCWVAALLWWKGALPSAAFGCYVAVGAGASGINAWRTLAAHRYDNEADELSMNEQLLDSCTISPSTLSGRLGQRLVTACHLLVAPVGLRYHALHHWIPSLPYHNLGRAHRLLVRALSPDAPYGRTIEPGFSPVIRDLFRRAFERS
jgi:fatty acid desaturase